MVVVVPVVPLRLNMPLLGFGTILMLPSPRLSEFVPKLLTMMYAQPWFDIGQIPPFVTTTDTESSNVLS